MTRYRTDNATDLAQRAVDAATRNPEALLVIAAGVALLLRRRGAASEPVDMAYRDYDDDFADTFDGPDAFPGDYSDTYAGGAERRQGGSAAGRFEDARDAVSDAAGSAASYASGLGESVSRTAGEYYETAGEYAAAAAGYVGEQGRRLSRQARRYGGRAGSAASHVWHDQPLVVLGVGLAAGAALAALIPSTEAEKRAMLPARDALREAATTGFDRVKQAASDAAHVLQEEAEERGMTAAGLKDIAKDAAGTFVQGVRGAGEEAAEKGVDKAREASKAAATGSSGAASSGAASSGAAAPKPASPGASGTGSAGGSKA